MKLNKEISLDFNLKNGGSNNKDNTILEKSLQKIVSGGFFILLSTCLSMLFAFISRVCIARVFSPDDFGIFSLGITLISMFSVLGLLGMQNGAVQKIAYYKAKNDSDKVKKMVLISLFISIISGILISSFIFVYSKYLSMNILHMPEMSSYLKIFSFGILFTIIINILTTIFQSYGLVKEKILYSDILSNLMFILGLIPLIYLGASFKWIVFSYILSLGLTNLLYICHFLKRKNTFHLANINLLTIIKSNFIFSNSKELLVLSLPLLFVSMMYQVMGWTDTLMLGYYMNSQIVGLYNASLNIGSLIIVIWATVLFLYKPIVSEFFSLHKREEIRRNFLIITKWVSAISFPLFITIFLFPDQVLKLFFGELYVSQSLTLQVLAIGYFFHNITGPNGATLTAMGYSRLLMWSTVVAAIVNIILNYFLIPVYGTVGAAFASTIALILVNIIRISVLKNIMELHPFTKKIVIPLVLSTTVVLFLHFILKKYVFICIWSFPLILLFVFIIHIFIIFLTKSLEDEDVNMILFMAEKVDWIYPFVKKFMTIL